MAIVNLTTLQDILGGTEPVNATVTAYVCKGGSRVVRIDGDEVVFPAPVVVEVVNGVPVQPLELLVLPAEVYWKILIATDNKIPLRRNVVLPGNVGPYDFEELIDVDPGTALPDPGTSAAAAYAALVESYAVRAEDAAERAEEAASNQGLIVPLPGFLTYVQGREALPVLNTNFGWDSEGLWFGPTAVDSEEAQESYPVFTNFTIPQNSAISVEFDVTVDEFCSDMGVALFVDGTTPLWSWDPNSTRIALQFNCPNPEISGIEGTGTVGEGSVPIPGPGVYRFVFTYDPNSEGDKVVFGYLAGDELNALVSLNETLPEGDYRIGFASDNDPEDDEFDSVTDRTYIKNLTITVDPETENEVVYTDSLTDGNSGGSGGSADTGDITFSGVQIIGAGEASGDGNGYGTMELVPDSGLYGNDQYLIIDPTGPNHIHIRAGGEQDNSTAELIVGGEDTNLRIIDNYGYAGLKGSYRYNSSYSQSDWESAVLTGDEFNTYVQVTNPAPYLIEFLNSSRFQVSNETSVRINLGEELQIFGLNTNEGGLIIYLPFVEQVLEPVPVDTLYFYWTNTSRIAIDSNDDEEIDIRGNGIDVRVGSTENIYVSADNRLILIGDSNVVISSNTGGHYLNDDENPANQIATVGDLPSGATGSFVSQDNKVITVTDGIITDISEIIP